MTDTTPVKYDVADEYQERTQDVIAPVAVAIVAAEPLRVQRHPAREFTTGSAVAPMGGPAVQIIGANPFRERLLLTTPHDQATAVYIGPNRDTVTQFGGFPLKPGACVELNTRHAVWALASPDASSGTYVFFLAEHVDG